MRIDLFSGGGGVLAGGAAAGRPFDLAVDVDPILTSSSANNYPGTRHVLADLSKTGKAAADDWKDGRSVELIFGGPPCQGFSFIGKRRPEDPRRSLLGHFFRMVSLLQPKTFVMENVEGLASRENMPLLHSAIERWCSNYMVLEPRVLDASRHGAATRRRRLFAVGYLANERDPLSWDDVQTAKGGHGPSVRDAIWDLQRSRSTGKSRLGGEIHRLDNRYKLSAYAAKLVSEDRTATGFQSTQHTPRVLARFARVPPGGIDRIGRHHRLNWTGLCPTLRAGTGADKGSHQAIRPLHPVENRVVTVREAARLQGFPDTHEFHSTIWHSFRMIGNSVAPPLAAAIIEWALEGRPHTDKETS